MQRFYISDHNLSADFRLSKNHETYHQLTKVLRCEVGDEVIFFDGENMIDFSYKISHISGAELVFEYIGETEKNSENTFQLNLYQALPNKLSKLEYILQKGVEVGYSSFVFFRSQRSQKLILSEKKIERLRKIIAEAVEQSGRNSVPELVIAEKTDLPEDNPQALNIIFHTDHSGSQALTPTLSQGEREQNVNIFVGPEGGWSDGEIQEYEKLGYKKSYLGDRILRCETVSSVVGFFISQKFLD